MKKSKATCFLFVLVCLFSLLQTGNVLSEATPAPQRTDPLPSAGERWFFDIDQDNSIITFFLKGNVHDTLGSPKEIFAGVFTDISPRGTLAGGGVRIKINAADLDTKDAGRDKRMKKKFLEVNKYPEIIFNSTGIKSSDLPAKPLDSITKDNPLQFELSGALTIHGVSRKISLGVNVYFFADKLIAEGSTTLVLQDYSIKNPSFLFFRTDDLVTIEFHIEMTKKDA